MPTRRSNADPKAVKQLAALKERLAKSKREEDVKAAWAKALGLECDTSEDVLAVHLSHPA